MWSSFAAVSSYVQAGIDIHTFSLMSLALSENTMDDFRSSPFFFETPIKYNLVRNGMISMVPNHYLDIDNHR